MNNVLLTREGGNPILDKYGPSLPISTSRTQSWMTSAALALAQPTENRPQMGILRPYFSDIKSPPSFAGRTRR